MSKMIFKFPYITNGEKVVKPVIIIDEVKMVEIPLENQVIIFNMDVVIQAKGTLIGKIRYGETWGDKPMRVSKVVRQINGIGDAGNKFETTIYIYLEL